VEAFVREKKIYCGGKLVAVSIFPQTKKRDLSVKGKRGKREKISGEKQRDLNDKNSKRYFNASAEGNFGEGDLVVHTTYDEKYLPKTIEEAERQKYNYIRRIEALSEKKGLGKIKWLAITQIGEKKNGTHRIHHHILLSTGLSRDEVESLWRVRKKKGQDKPDMLGFVNADRLRPNEKGISQMAGYMSRDSAGKRRWTCSQNLDKPWARKNDNTYSRRQMEKISKLPADCEEFREFWKKQYPDHTVIDIEQPQPKPEYAEKKTIFHEMYEWSFYIQLHTDKPGIKAKRRC
jgi:hypothetical protein